MAKVLGVGGIFFKAKNPEQLGKWYSEHLGIDLDPSFTGAVFQHTVLPEKAYTVWSPFDANTKYFEPSNQSFMINLVVDDVEDALNQVKAGGAEIVGETKTIEFGKFGWFIDPEGNKIELWEPM